MLSITPGFSQGERQSGTYKGFSPKAGKSSGEAGLALIPEIAGLSPFILFWTKS
jgi:hypothetical protein